jgi:hypothetical protein
VEPLHVRHEQTDAEPRAVFRVLLVLLGFTALVAAGLVYLTLGMVAVEEAADPPRAPLAQEPGRLPAEPRLQTQPFVDVETLRAEERELLTSYGWVDEKAGVVRIPIEQAKELLLRRGLPVASPAPATASPLAGARR